MWQQDDKAEKNKLDEKILLLVNEWVINKQTKILLNRKNQQNNQKSSQNSQLLNKNEMKKNEIKLKKLTLEKYHDKISDFWYIFANDSVNYFRVQFLKHFNKL